MGSGRWIGRLKRRILKVVDAAGFDLEKLEGSRGYSLVRRTPIGRDHLVDIRRISPGPVRWVFDVGASVGQSALDFAAAFPEAQIHSFEPDPASFDQMLSNSAHQPRIRPHRIALGDTVGSATLFQNRFAQTNSLLPVDPNSVAYLVSPLLIEPIGSTPVVVSTVDQSCLENSVDRIDLLKIDTQGCELQVLKGASRMLAKSCVSLIYIEVCFVPFYQNQPLFPELYEYLYARNFRLVGLYEGGIRTHYYQVGCNALFVEERMGRRKP